MLTSRPTPRQPPFHPVTAGPTPSCNGNGIAPSLSKLTQHAPPPTAPSWSGSPIRLAFLTPTLLMGGAERWLISLARCCDRRRVEWIGTALAFGSPVHPDLCREMSAYMPIYAGPEVVPLEDANSIRRCPSAPAALQTVLKDADILITWGIPQRARVNLPTKRDRQELQETLRNVGQTDVIQQIDDLQRAIIVCPQT